MNEDEPKTPLAPNRRELELIEMLREYLFLIGHTEELAQMTRNPEDLTRGIDKSGLQLWAEVANRNCESKTQEARSKGQTRQGKKFCWLSLFRRMEVGETTWMTPSQLVRLFRTQLPIPCREFHGPPGEPSANSKPNKATPTPPLK